MAGAWYGPGHNEYRNSSDHDLSMEVSYKIVPDKRVKGQLKGLGKPHEKNSIWIFNPLQP